MSKSGRTSGRTRTKGPSWPKTLSHWRTFRNFWPEPGRHGCTDEDGARWPVRDTRRVCVPFSETTKDPLRRSGVTLPHFCPSPSLPSERTAARHRKVKFGVVKHLKLDSLYNNDEGTMEAVTGLYVWPRSLTTKDTLRKVLIDVVPVTVRLLSPCTTIQSRHCDHPHPHATPHPDNSPSKDVEGGSVREVPITSSRNQKK